MAQVFHSCSKSDDVFIVFGWHVVGNIATNGLCSDRCGRTEQSKLLWNVWRFTVIISLPVSYYMHIYCELYRPNLPPLMWMQPGVARPFIAGVEGCKRWKQQQQSLARESRTGWDSASLTYLGFTRKPSDRCGIASHWNVRKKITHEEDTCNRDGQGFQNWISNSHCRPQIVNLRKRVPRILKKPQKLK